MGLEWFNITPLFYSPRPLLKKMIRRFLTIALLVSGFPFLYLQQSSDFTYFNLTSNPENKGEQILASLQDADVTPKETAQRKRPALVRYTVSRGDTLGKIWEAIGGDSLEALEAEKALKNVGASRLNIGDELEFAVGDEGEIRRIRRRLEDGRVITVQADDTGFSSRVREPEVRAVSRSVTGTITSSFVAAAHDAGIPDEVIDDFVDLFSSRLDFERRVQAGDTFSILYTENKTSNGIRLEPGPIEAASFHSNGRLLAAVRYVTGDGQARYFNERGEMLGDYFLRYPLQFTRITSVFTKSRFHPILKINRPHHGIDFSAPQGTPVRAVADGVVEFAGYSKSAGNMIQIRHNAVYATVYRHLSRITKSVKKGARVGRGLVIGGVGSTGLSTGPHLCFSLYKNGVYVDPLGKDLPQLTASSDRIPEKILSDRVEALRINHEGLILAHTDLGFFPTA